MAEVKRIKKGLDIHLYGAIPNKEAEELLASEFAIVPDDYLGYIWKLDVKVGDKVQKGSPILHDKDLAKINICSPVSGYVRDIVRGERRKIEAVVIEKDDSNEEVLHIKPTVAAEIIDLLCRSGLWAMMRQRPYDIIPNPDVKPRDIFVTAFDSSPLASEILTSNYTRILEVGLKTLSKLTDGKVYLGVKYGSGISSTVANVTEYYGPHPAGNVGVQIAAIKPINKGEVVWSLDARTVERIGYLMEYGTFDSSAVVAITGEKVCRPRLVKTNIGVSISSLLTNNINDDCDVRIISGNVLTGYKVNLNDGFLRYPYRQVTVIPEGNTADEFMGWASVNPMRYSVKHWFPAFLRGLSKQFSFDARLKGGERAMIVSGEYDKVFPMDIYPEYLIKAILAFDIDKMEQLGIYEVAPEDFALAEFVDTSKLELQRIVREGLDKLYKELN